MSFSDELNTLIPGGCHTYSRGDDQFPDNAPQILRNGKGAYVYDPNGEKYLDYGMALRSISIGYAESRINDAAISEINKGNNLTRASMTELEAAKLIVELIPSIEMVKFAKNGSNVTTAAIKLARAYTNKKYIAVCQDHPFFSFDDWFISTTQIKRGIPVDHSVLTFKYNDIESLINIFNQNEDIACVILEPVTFSEPIKDGEINFLQMVKKLCEKNNSVLILDEMITGFRWDLKGASHFYNVDPDLITFGKAMANGFSLAALGGKRRIMNLGNIKEKGMERTFLLSSTHGAEMSSLGAFIETVRFYRDNNVIDHIWKYGASLIDGINKIANELGIHNFFYFTGYPCLPYYVTKDINGNNSLELRTLFIQEMLKHNIIIPYVSISYSHRENELNITLSAVKCSLKIYKKALYGNVMDYITGKVIKPVFRKYN